MDLACCCTRRCAGLNCGSDSVPKSPRNFGRWSRPISQRFEAEYRASAGVHCEVIPAGDQFMPVHRSSLRRPLVAIAMVLASSLYAIAQQPPAPSRVRGTIEGVDGDVLSVKSRSGEDVKLHMTGDMRVVGIVKISLSEIKVGSFIGAT